MKGLEELDQIFENIHGMRNIFESAYKMLAFGVNTVEFKYNESTCLSSVMNYYMVMSSKLHNRSTGKLTSCLLYPRKANFRARTTVIYERRLDRL